MVFVAEIHRLGGHHKRQFFFFPLVDERFLSPRDRPHQDKDNGSATACPQSQFYLAPPPLARIMHKFSTAVAPSSALTALRFLVFLDLLHEYIFGSLRGAPCQRGACGTSPQKPIHNPD